MARTFNGTSSDQVSVPAIADLTGTWTVAGWFRRGHSGQANDEYLYLRSNPAAGEAAPNQLSVYVQGTTNAATTGDHIRVDVPFVAQIILSVARILDTAWHHYAATKTGTTWALYIDGVLDTSLTSAQAQDSAATTSVQLFTCTSDATTGSDWFGDGGETTVWDIDLTPGEIATLAHGLPGNQMRRGHQAMYVPMRASDSFVIDEVNRRLATVLGTVPTAQRNEPRAMLRAFFSRLAGTSTNIATGAGSSTGVGTATGVGASTAAASGSSDGISSATGASITYGAGAGTPIGLLLTLLVSGSVLSSNGQAAGTGDANAVGASTAAADGSAAGVALSAGVGASTVAGDGLSTGAGAASGAAIGPLAVGAGIGANGLSFALARSTSTAKGNTFRNDWLKLIFNGTPIANIADNAASSPLTNFYVAFHTADPGNSGTQDVNEVSYTGYARVAVARTSSGWMITNDTVNPTVPITFGMMSGGAGSIITYASIGVASSGATKILYSGPISPTIAMMNGVMPRLSAISLAVEG